ncbi:hypothetical protein NE865_06830 [Phthorimaea operculella]|nr:hypothetical protein NE865_06830 [Phthorimaea operculella]
MTDSSSFSSLMALVDSHLSKTSIQASHSEDPSNVSGRIPIPSLTQPGTLSDSRLQLGSCPRLIPSFKLSDRVSDSSIQDVLAGQVANMLRAKELKKQEEEKQRLAEEMKKMKLEEPDDCVIDLMQALKTPWEPPPPPKEETLSSSSSFESLFQPKFIDCDDTPETKSPEPLLPCKTDMTYILYQKVRKSKGSTFGRVISSRLKPVAYPYLREKVESNIVPFDFSTPSPCDLIKEKLRRPTVSCGVTSQDILNFI